MTRVFDEQRLALGIDTQVDFSGPLDLGVPANLADDATAVIREAVSNIARHAAAHSVQVRVDLTGDLLTLEVTDDGVGLQRTDRSSGLGNMRRRAEAHGGTLELSVPAGGGTHLRWTAKIDGER